MKQYHVRRVFCCIYRRIHRDAHIGLAKRRNVINPVAQKAHCVAVLTQGGNQTDLLTRCKLRKNVNFFNRSAKFAVCHFIQLGAGQHGFGRNPHPSAYRDRHVRLIPRQNFGSHLQSFERRHGRLCGFFGRIKERQIPHQNHILFIGRGNLVLLSYIFSCNGDDLHTVLKHLIYHRGYALHPAFLYRQNFIPILHMAATGNDVGDIPFHNELTFSVFVCHKSADKLAGIVKGNLVYFLILSEQISVMRLAPRHSLTGKNCVINGIADAGMIEAV